MLASQMSEGSDKEIESNISAYSQTGKKENSLNGEFDAKTIEHVSKTTKNFITRGGFSCHEVLTTLNTIYPSETSDTRFQPESLFSTPVNEAVPAILDGTRKPITSEHLTEYHERSKGSEDKPETQKPLEEVKNLSYVQSQPDEPENQNEQQLIESPNYESNQTEAPRTINKPKTPYNEFLQKLKHPRCLSIVTEIKNFVESFQDSMSAEKAANQVHQFITLIRDSFLQLEIFKNEEPLQLLDKLEKFVVQKLYNNLLRTLGPNITADESLFDKIRCLDWIEFKHLELDHDFDPAIVSTAVNEIRKLEKMRCPRDKLVLILNCCRAIVSILESEVNNKDHSRFASADDILPLLIYVIIKANPSHLNLQVEFIQLFRHPSLHIKEEVYFFTQFSSAVLFISNLGDNTQLHISDEEFYKLFTNAMERYNITNIDLPILAKSSQIKRNDVANFENSKSESLDVLKKLYDKALATRGTFENITNIEQLKIIEIREIVKEYNGLIELKKFIIQNLN